MDAMNVDCLKFCLYSIAFYCVTTQPTPVYVHIGDPLTLPCTVDNYTRASWEGPCLNTAVCITNTTPYFDGLEKKQDLPNIITLNIGEDQLGKSYDLYISKVSNKSRGSYKCFGFDGIVPNARTFEVFFKDPPDVSIVFLNECTLRCSATGEPNIATYMSWQHYSDLGTVTHYNGSEFLNLCCSCKRYMVNGLYICGATNGIRHIDGNDTSFGNISVYLKGVPEILPKTNRIQYGKYNESGTLQVFIYSITLITEARLLRNSIVIESSLRPTINYSFKNEHRLVHHLAVLQHVDFATYTFEVKNEQGAINVTVNLVAKDDVTDDKSETNSGNGQLYTTYFIVISIGSSIVGALLSRFVYRCCKKVRKRSNIVNVVPEVQYDEIDEENLQEMDDIRIHAIVQRQDSSDVTHSEINVQVENENVVDISENSVVVESEDSLDIILGEDGSSSDDSNEVPRHSYINAPLSVRNKYQSLETPRPGDDNYSKQSTTMPVETRYYNLSV